MTENVPQTGEEVKQIFYPNWGATIDRDCGIGPKMGNNLKKLREERGWSHQRAADEMGVSRGQFIKLERGERRLTLDYILSSARAFGVQDAEIISRGTVPIVGAVGAGAAMILYAEGQDPKETTPAPLGASEYTVAIVITGESLGEAFDGWLLYYDDVKRPVTPDLIGKLCVVGLSDGRILVKMIKNGQLRGRFTLISNTEQPLYDVTIEWAARVNQMTPR